MYAICGWMGQIADAPASDGILDGMLRVGGAAGLDPGLAGAGRIRDPGGSVGSLAGAGLVYADAELVVCLTEAVSGSGGSVPGETLDASAVARLYRAHGDALPAHCHGSFALAILDLRRRQCLLAVDRAGNRPLYVYRSGEAVAFASRLSALRAIPDFQAHLSDQAVFAYLYSQVIPSPGTIYQGVEKLLPAQAITFNPLGRHDFFYWRMPYRDTNPTPLPDLKREFRTLLPAVVRQAADAPDPGTGAVGCFLSGGTDSSTVVGTLSELRRAPVRTYSMGFAAQGFDEIEYARLAARHFGTAAREYYVQPQDVLDAIPLVAAYCDEPFANASIVPAYLCARFAREDGCTRLLAGDGGDEIFGGNARYANQQVFEIYRNLPAWLRQGVVDPVAAIPGLGSVPIARKFKSYVEQARIPLPDRLESYNFLHRTPLADVFDPGFLARVDPQAPLADQRACYERTGSAAIVNRMMHLDLKITLADNDLRKVNQACELAGIDVRYPLLDERLMIFAAGVPPRLQLKDNRLRWFFKQALADFLPPQIIAKKKHGFGMPVGLWMAQHAPLRALTEDSLAALRARGILNPAYLDWLRAQHAGEHPSYYGVMLWVLVMLEQWLQTHGHGS